MTPFSQYKGWLAEGGIRNALIVSGPAVKRPAGSINHGLMHVADLMPTLLEVAGTRYPKASQPELPPLIGKSWGPMLAGKVDSARTDKDYLAWEVFGNRAVRQGDWKLRWQFKPYGKGDWELFNVAKDPAERKDLAAQNPDKVKAMVALWDELRPGQQRGPAESLAVRDPGKGDAATSSGRRRLPAAHLQAAVRAAQGHAGRSEALSVADPR